MLRAARRRWPAAACPPAPPTSCPTRGDPLGAIGRNSGSSVAESAGAQTDSEWEACVSGNEGVLLVREDTIIKGEIRNCRHMEVYGYVEGDVAADNLLVHPSGRCFGTLQIGSADVHGTLQGDVTVKNLINIRSTGAVN